MSLEALVHATEKYLKVSDHWFYAPAVMHKWPKNMKPAPGEFMKLNDEPLTYKWINPFRADDKASAALANHLWQEFRLNAEPVNNISGTFVKIVFDQKDSDKIQSTMAQLENKTLNPQKPDPEKNNGEEFPDNLVPGRKWVKGLPPKHHRMREQTASHGEEEEPPPLFTKIVDGKGKAANDDTERAF